MRAVKEQSWGQSWRETGTEAGTFCLMIRKNTLQSGTEFSQDKR